jgi:hypothetical protein
VLSNKLCAACLSLSFLKLLFNGGRLPFDAFSFCAL